MASDTLRVRLALGTLAACLTLGPALTACTSNAGAVAPTSDNTVQIDKPTTEPTEDSENTQNNGEVDLNHLTCVGDTFTSTLPNDPTYVRVSPEDAQRAYDCLDAAGQVKMVGGGASFRGDFYMLQGTVNDKTIIFNISNDQADTNNFGVLTAGLLGG